MKPFEEFGKSTALNVVRQKRTQCNLARHLSEGGTHSTQEWDRCAGDGLLAHLHPIILNQFCKRAIMAFVGFLGSITFEKSGHDLIRLRNPIEEHTSEESDCEFNDRFFAHILHLLFIAKGDLPLK